MKSVRDQVQDLMYSTPHLLAEDVATRFNLTIDEAEHMLIELQATELEGQDDQ